MVAVIASTILGQALLIHELKEEISKQTIRSLTPDQKQRLLHSLQLGVAEHYSFQINSIPNCDECEQFAEGLREFLSSIPGWNVDGGTLSFGGAPWHYGMWIVSRADEKDSVPVKKLSGAFRDAGLPLLSDTEEGGKGTFVIIIARQKLKLQTHLFFSEKVYSFLQLLCQKGNLGSEYWRFAACPEARL